MAIADRKRVRVEITEETLTRLLEKGHVCAADFRCLDCKSKQCLWRLCLESCTNSMPTGTREKSTVISSARGMGSAIPGNGAHGMRKKSLSG
ncbi:MAG TPA: hypothetical protein PKV75_00535 [Desulfobacterales bacterium]|nr:hypothetical protein [Desulfobacterales bacterium]